MLLLIFVVIFVFAVIATLFHQRNIIAPPPTWVKSDIDIEVIGRNATWGPSETWPKCTKENPWNGKTLPVLHVDGDFLEDFDDLLRCPNCGHTWSIGPDV